MPTPAKNINLAPLQTLTVSFNDGQPTTTTTDSRPSRRLVRPASVNHHRRSDQTRPPGNWDTYWSYGWPKGSVTWRYKTSSIRAVSSGCAVLDSDFGSLFPDMTGVNNLMSNCRLKALAQGTASTTQLNAAMAQAKDTIKLVGSTATTMATRLHHLMDGKGGLFRRLGRMSQWRGIPDEYLGYLYGFRPFGSDVANAFSKLNEFNERGYEYSMILHGSLSGPASQPSRAWSPCFRYADAAGAYHVGSTRSTGKMFASCAYRFDLPRWYLEQTPVIQAPFTDAYELTKLSFVLDWFVPIGNWLGALQSAQWSPFFVEGWETRFIECEETFLSPPTGAGGLNTYNVVGCSLEGTRHYGRMIRNAVFSYPSTVLQRPALNPFPGLQQGAQGLALLTQAFKRWR